MEIITSLQNAKVKQWVRYQMKKHRDQDGVFLAEGEHLVSEAQKAGILREVMVVDEHHTALSVPVTQVTTEILKKISSTQSGVNIIGLCDFVNQKPSGYDRWLICDDIQDPGNLGTIIRTALSFGFDAIALSSGCADVYNEKTLRSSQGAVFHLPVIRKNLMEVIFDLKKQGVTVLASTLQDATPLSKLSVGVPLAVILGNEGQGIHSELIYRSDFRVKIEMDGFESLNVAVAAGIFCYTWRK